MKKLHAYITSLLQVDNDRAEKVIQQLKIHYSNWEELDEKTLNFVITLSNTIVTLSEIIARHERELEDMKAKEQFNQK